MTSHALRASSFVFLAKKHAAPVRAQSYRTPAHPGLLVKLGTWVTRRVTSKLTESLRANATRLVDNAVWFRGALASLEDLEQGPLDPDFKLNDSIREAEDDASSLLDKLVHDRAYYAAHPIPGIEDCIRGVDSLILACTEYREALRRFRGALQARESSLEAIALAQSGAAAELEDLPDLIL